MSDASQVRSPLRPVSGYEFASRVLDRFPEDGVQKLLDYARNESDWLEKKAGVYLWDKDPDLEKLRKKGVDDDTFKEQHQFLENKLCLVIAEAIVAFRNMRGGVVFIGIHDSPANRVVPLRDNDPKGFLGKEKNDFDKYIRQAVEARLWPENEIFEGENADWRRPGLLRSRVFETRTAKYGGETILALLVRAPRPDEAPLIFKEEPRGGRSKDWLLYREPGSKGEIKRVVLVHPSATSLNKFLIDDRQPALEKKDLAEQTAQWGIEFSAPEPPPLPKKASRFSFRPIAVAIALCAAVPVLLVALVIVLVLVFPAEEDDEDDAANGRTIPKNTASAPASIPVLSVSTPKTVPAKSPDASPVRTVSTPKTAPSSSSSSGGFDRTVTIDDVYRPAKRAVSKSQPTAAGTSEWDEEDRFVARRKLKESLLRWKEDLSKMCTAFDEPVPDAAGTAVLGVGKTFAVLDVGTSGISKLVLDGGTLVAQPLSVPKIKDARARCDALLADVEAKRIPDDVLREPDLFVAEQSSSFRDLREPDWGVPVLTVPVEVGTLGGVIRSDSSMVRIRGPFVPGPNGAGAVSIQGMAEFFLPGVSPDVPLRGSYSVVADDPGSRSPQKIRHVHQHLIFWNAHGSDPEKTRKKAYDSALRARPDANGDIAVGSGSTLILSEVPTDGSVKRIVLRGGTLAFLPPRSDSDSLIEVLTFEIPVLVGKEGGEIGACRQNGGRPAWGVLEARLRSSVENEFGERPTVVAAGDVLLDGDRFSSKVRVETFHDRRSGASKVTRVFSGSRSPNGPMDWDEPGRGDYRFCDFSGPFPSELSRKH